MPDSEDEAGGDQTSVDHFERRWATYQKVMTHNYIFHREVYGILADQLRGTHDNAIDFLDIACGDAAATVAALKSLPVAEYHGIDLSGAALSLAQRNLQTLGCSVRLYKQDFLDALSNWTRPVDVVWIGQSLHHLASPSKLQLMRHVHRVLREDGVFLIWEPVLLEGEGRDMWMARFDAHSRASWPLLQAGELETVSAHNRQFDHPEPSSNWLALGHEAGFIEASQLFLDPPRLAGMYMFRNGHLT